MIDIDKLYEEINSKYIPEWNKALKENTDGLIKLSCEKLDSEHFPVPSSSIIFSRDEKDKGYNFPILTYSDMTIFNIRKLILPLLPLLFKDPASLKFQMIENGNIDGIFQEAIYNIRIDSDSGILSLNDVFSKEALNSITGMGPTDIIKFLKGYMKLINSSLKHLYRDHKFNSKLESSYPYLIKHLNSVVNEVIGFYNSHLSIFGITNFKMNGM